MSDQIRMPGGEIDHRPLHTYFLLDTSGSMSVDGKIQQLNFAMHEATPALAATAGENPQAAVVVRELAFGGSARWLADGTPVDTFRHTDLTATGATPMGAAFRLLLDELRQNMPGRSIPPVLVLVSDGQPTDPDFESCLAELLADPWGSRATRVAIAIGADADTAVLERFVNDPAIPVLRADNPESLVAYIKWASTEPVRAASAPPSQAVGAGATNGGLNIVAPPAPQVFGPGVW